MSVPAMQLQTAQSLAELLRGMADAPDMPVHGISSDSRALKAGFLFLACGGEGGRHGLHYAANAVAAGACAIAWDSNTAELPDGLSIPTVAVDNLSAHLGEIANRYYGYPSHDLQAVGVTGTNGKTTVAWLIAQSLQRLGQRCGYLGTLGYGVGELEGAEGMTTPAAIELHARLADFVDQGATHAALEVSSHALAQARVDGVRFDTVMFTNLTRDHLDYHGDMRSYFESKARLFLSCESRVKIINLDTDFGTELAARCGQDVVTVSGRFDRVANGRPYVFCRSVVAKQNGSDISFASSWGDGKFTLPMPGDFNVENAMSVLAYLLTAGVELQQACDVLEIAEAPLGRMQRVANAGRSIYIDYAHTPDAIESALRALRPHCRGKLYCVFGCGGDRDAGKRPLIGKAAERLADRVVITTDNPRSENASLITDDVLQGFTRPETAIVIEDRAAAINWAVSSATPDDVVLIAGKGHEAYQEIDGVRAPFSDYRVAFAVAATVEENA